ncbi:MAG TPA: amine dehydrogenase large subunit [Acidobacteriota bacterium]|jgi:hypothetical protein
MTNHRHVKSKTVAIELIILLLITAISALAAERDGHEFLCVVDPVRGASDTRIILIDPEALRVIQTIRSGYDPQIAVSPDGRRLYLSDRRGTQELFTVIEFGTWNVLLSVESPQRIYHKVYGRDALAVSPDGRHVYIHKMRILPGQFDIPGGSVPRTDEWWDIFDTNSGVFLPRPPHVENCGIVRLFPQAGTLTMICPNRGEASPADVESGTVNQPFRDPKGERLRLPSLAGSAAAANGSLIYLVSRKGELFALNLRDRSIASAARLELPEKTIVANGLVALSPAGDRLYVGVGQAALTDRRYGQGILVFDTGSWKQTGKIEPARSVFSMAVAQDGRRLYTVDPATRTLTVYDVKTGEQVGLMKNLGDSPALLISASYR